MSKPDRSRAPNVSKVGFDRLQEPPRILAARDERSRDFAFAVAFQHQQHALAAGKLGRFFDQKRLDRRRGSQSVEPQARIRQPLEGLANIGLDREMGDPALCGNLALRAVLEPCGNDFAIDRDLVEIVAAQPLVAQVRDPIKQKRVRPLQGLVRLAVFVARGQRLRVPPPDFLGSENVGLGEGLRAMHGRSACRCFERCGPVATSQMRLAEFRK